MAKNNSLISLGARLRSCSKYYINLNTKRVITFIQQMMSKYSIPTFTPAEFEIDTDIFKVKPNDFRYILCFRKNNDVTFRHYGTDLKSAEKSRNSIDGSVLFLEISSTMLANNNQHECKEYKCIRRSGAGTTLVSNIFHQSQNCPGRYYNIRSFYIKIVCYTIGNLDYFKVVHSCGSIPSMKTEQTYRNYSEEGNWADLAVNYIHPTQQLYILIDGFINNPELRTFEPTLHNFSKYISEAKGRYNFLREQTLYNSDINSLIDGIKCY